MGGGKEVRQPEKQYYSGHGGGDNDFWREVERSAFVFSDSLQAGGCLDASHEEGRIDTSPAADLGSLLQERWFAGVVCVAN